MSSTISWECSSVAEFFQCCNWQGFPSPPERESVSNLQQEFLDNWQCLAVEEFFSFGNWNGRSHSINSGDRPEIAFSITLPVAEFFQCFDWDGRIVANTNLGIKSNVATPAEDKTTSTPTKQITIQDLSQLF